MMGKFNCLPLLGLSIIQIRFAINFSPSKVVESTICQFCPYDMPTCQCSVKLDVWPTCQSHNSLLPLSGLLVSC